MDGCVEVAAKRRFFKIYCGKNPTEIACFLYILSNLLPKITICFLFNEANLGH